MDAAPAASTPMMRTPGSRARRATATPASRPPPPTGTSTTPASGASSASSRPRVPWPAMMRRVVEGRHEARRRARRPRPCASAMQLVDQRVAEADLGAVGPGGLHLGERRGGGHEDHRALAEQRGGQRHALGVVAGRGRHHQVLARRGRGARGGGTRPRILNEPVRWRCSALSRTSAPAERGEGRWTARWGWAGGSRPARPGPPRSRRPAPTRRRRHGADPTTRPPPRPLDPWRPDRRSPTWGDGSAICSARARAPYRVTPAQSPSVDACPGSPEQFRTKESSRAHLHPQISEIDRAWVLVDAEGLVLGRLATEVARILRGKHKPTYAPHIDTGDHVVIINADKVVLTSGKAEKKQVYRHSGFPGGIKAQHLRRLPRAQAGRRGPQLHPRHAAAQPPRCGPAQEAEGLRRPHPPARCPAAADRSSWPTPAAARRRSSTREQATGAVHRPPQGSRRPSPPP